MTAPRSKEVKSHDSIFAGRVLTAMAGRVSAELAAFSSWMVVGFAAVLGLFAANIDTVAKFVDPEALGTAIYLFLVAVVFNVVQRYMAAMVAGGVAVGKEIESVPVQSDLDMPSVLRQIEEATLWPTRLVVRWSIGKILEGDYAVGGRLNARLAQAQAWFVLVQVVAVVSSALVIANALQG